MKIDNNVKSCLEFKADKSKEELITLLVCVFDYSNELAHRVYKIWRNKYKLANYKTEESKYTKEELKLLRKLDREYLKREKKKDWW